MRFDPKVMAAVGCVWWRRRMGQWQGRTPGAGGKGF